LKQVLAGLPAVEGRRAQGFLKRLEFVDQRKTTLYRALEVLLEAQRDFLLTGDLGRRKPFTQRALSSRLDADPSALNRLISNKSIQLPWGLEAPLKTFLPSSKSLMRERLEALAKDKPHLSDERLRLEMARLHAVRLSRRSIAQYRKELGIGSRRRRMGRV
jgi:RNA polymerase sigma-54 factor